MQDCGPTSDSMLINYKVGLRNSFTKIVLSTEKSKSLYLRKAKQVQFIAEQEVQSLFYNPPFFFETLHMHLYSLFFLLQYNNVFQSGGLIMSLYHSAHLGTHTSAPNTGPCYTFTRAGPPASRSAFSFLRTNSRHGGKGRSESGRRRRQLCSVAALVGRRGHRREERGRWRRRAGGAGRWGTRGRSWATRWAASAGGATSPPGPSPEPSPTTSGSSPRASSRRSRR